MASAKTSFTFSCPKCDKTLRTASRPAEGKKIKCPACGKPFVPELDDAEDDAEAVQEKPTLKAKAKTKVKANTAKPIAKKSRPKDDDDDDDDRPAKKKPAKKSNLLIILLLLVLGGGFFVSLGLCGVGAFVWPGFLTTKTETKLAHDGKAKDADANKTDTPATDANKTDGNKTDGNKTDGKTKDDAKDKDADKDKSKKEDPNKIDALVVDAETLAKEFKADSKAAHAKYQGKLLEVSGKVLMSLPQVDSVIMQNGEKIVGKKVPKLVQGMFDKAFEAEIAKLKAGESITFRGRYFNDGINILLKDCELLGVEAVKNDGKKPPETKPFSSNKIADFVPQQANYLIGLNALDLRRRNQLDPILKDLESSLPPGGFPPIFMEAARNCDEVLMCMDASDKKRGMMAVLFSSPQAMQDIKAKLKLGPEQMLADRYRIHRQDDKELAPQVLFPGDRLMLLCELPDDELIALMQNAENKQGAPNPAMQLANNVKRDPLWIAISFGETERMMFKDTERQFTDLPDAKPLLEALARSKGATIALNVFLPNYQLRVNVECNDPADAKLIHSSLLSARSFLIKEWMPKAQPPITVQTLINAVALQSSGNSASMSFFFSKQTIDDLAKLSNSKGPNPPPRDVASKDKIQPKDAMPKDFPFKDRKDFVPPKDLAGKDFPPRKDVMIKDFMPKDFAPKDFGPKDLAQKDAPPKDGPLPKSGTYLDGFVYQNMPAKAQETKQMKLRRGQTIRVVEQSIALPGKKGIDKKAVFTPGQAETRIEILGGDGAGDVPLAQSMRQGVFNVLEFTAPADGVYRLRITNVGPGAILTSKGGVYAK